MIVKCPITDLKIGMYVSNPGLSEMTNPHIYLVEGPIEDERQISLVSEVFTEAYIDTEKGEYFLTHPEEKAALESLFNAVACSGEGVTPGPGLDDALERMKAAEGMYLELLETFRSISKRMQGARAVDLQACESLTGTLVATEEKMLLAMLLVTRMRSHDPYAYTHSLNVSLLSVMAARSEGAPQERQMVYGLAGMFHDIGKLRIPDKILKKAGRLTPAEFEEVKRHPAYARDMLSEHNKISEDVVAAAYQHHEHFDGSGYPLGLTGDQVSKLGAVVGLLDTYDALRTDRYYKEAISSHKAICVIYGLRGKTFSPQLVDQLVKAVGIYPIGSIVVLASGKKGVVTRQNDANLLRPHIRLVLDENNRYCRRRDVDLLREDASGPYAIKDTLTNKECRIHVASMLD